MNSLTPKFSSPLPSHFFGLWSKYWSGLGFLTPPVHYYKETISSGALLVSPVSDEQMSSFVKSQEANTNYHFAAQGQTLLDERVWLGHWSSVSIDIAASANLPLMNHPSIRVPGTEGWS